MKKITNKVELYYKLCLAFTFKYFEEQVIANINNKYPYLSLIVNNASNFLVKLDSYMENNSAEDELNKIFPRFSYIENALQKQFKTLDSLKEHIDKSTSFCDLLVDKIFVVHQWEKEFAKDSNKFININDQEFLGQIALNNTNFYKKLDAIEKINNQNILKQLVLNNEDANIKEYALSKITDQEFLEKVSLDDEDPYIRQFAIKTINKIKNTNI